MRTVSVFCGVTLAAVAAASLGGAQCKTLEDGFAVPPKENRPVVWWWFDNEAPDESVLKDIRAMKRAGLGGFHFRKFVTDPKKFKLALHEAAELDLDVVTMVGAGGCGHDGVPPKFSQKELVYTSVIVTGGQTVSQKLKRTGVKIKFWNEKNFSLNYFTDLRTYAVPKSDGPVSVDSLIDVTPFLDPTRTCSSGRTRLRANGRFSASDGRRNRSDGPETP